MESKDTRLPRMGERFATTLEAIIAMEEFAFGVDEIVVVNDTRIWNASEPQVLVRGTKDRVHTLWNTSRWLSLETLALFTPLDTPEDERIAFARRELEYRIDQAKSEIRESERSIKLHERNLEHKRERLVVLERKLEHELQPIEQENSNE